MKLIEKIYNSTTEMADYMESTKSRDSWASYSVADEKTFGDDWAGESFADALTMMKEGDMESAKLIRNAGDIKNTYKGMAPRVRLSVRGCVPSVPNYLIGVPCNMLDIRRESQKNPVISLYINAVIACGVTRKQSAEAALKIANVVKEVEAKGIRVSIFVGMINYTVDTKAFYSLFTKVKDSKAPFNICNVAFPLVNPAFFRRVCLGWLEREREIIYGHGYVSYFRELKEKTGKEYKGVKIDLQKAILSRYDENDISRLFNEYLKKGE